MKIVSLNPTEKRVTKQEDRGLCAAGGDNNKNVESVQVDVAGASSRGKKVKEGNNYRSIERASEPVRE